MRILIADRNVRLLEAISHTFARDFTITTAMTLQRCSDLLRRGDFDLAIVSEKLSDGPGLRLLGELARQSPDTLRIFAARRSRLELLGDRLGRLGLFRTLSYPIEAQKLSSTLTLARAGLNGRTRTLSSPAAVAPALSPTPRPVIERIRFTFTDATLAINVPMLIPTRIVRRSGVPAVARPRSIAPRAPALQPAPSRVQPFAPRPVPSRIQPLALQPTPSRIPPLAPSRVTPSRPAALSRKPSLMLGTTMAAVLAMLALVLHWPVHSTDAPHSRLEKRLPDVPAVSRQNFASPSLTLPIPAAPNSAVRSDPKPTPPTPDAEQPLPEVATTTTPLADPSTFGSEAYEPIYSN